MAIHIAKLGQYRINRAGRVISVNDSSTTLRDVLDCSTEWRVTPDPAIPSTGNPAAVPPTTYPTMEEYLVREEVAGFRLGTLNIGIIVTYD